MASTVAVPLDMASDDMDRCGARILSRDVDCNILAFNLC
jgi:hypothetical protein